MKLNRKEMALSCIEWVKDFKRKRQQGSIPRAAGCIMIFFNEDDPGSGVCVATVNAKERIARELKDVLRKIEERVIIDPSGVN